MLKIDQIQRKDETAATKPEPQLRRIRTGHTITKLDTVRRDGLPNRKPEAFNDSTIETLLNASNEMFVVVQRSSLEIFAVNKALENKLNTSYVDLNSLYSLFLQDTLAEIAAGNSKITNQVMTNAEGQDNHVDIEITQIYWCGQDALLLKIIEKEEETISKEDHEAAIEAVKRLSAGVAHDVRNVIHVLLGNLGMMELDSIDTKDEYNISGMIASVQRGVSILNTYMRFNTNAELKLEKNDLYKFVEEEITSLLKWQTEQNIKLKFIKTATSCICNFNALAMSQVILNLVQNSKDAMPSGGTITVAIENYDLGDISHARWREEVNQNGVCIYFEDDGTGISPEILNDIFEPEFSTKRTSLNRYGLGLAVVKRLIKEHGGKMFVESETGENSYTRFYIFLPKDT